MSIYTIFVVYLGQIFRCKTVFSTYNNFVGTKHDDSWKSSHSHWRVIQDQVWLSLMAKSWSRWFREGQVWQLLKVNSRPLLHHQDQVWRSLMAKSWSWWVYRDRAWLSMRTNSGSSPRRSGPGMAILDGQVEVTTILRGPSMASIERQLEAIAASPGPSMAIFDGQIKVVMILRWPGMIVFDSQIKIIVLGRLST